MGRNEGTCASGITREVSVQPTEVLARVHDGAHTKNERDTGNHLGQATKENREILREEQG